MVSLSGIMSVIASGTPPEVNPPGIHKLLAPVSFPLGIRIFILEISSTSILTKPPPSLKYPLGNPRLSSIIDISPSALEIISSQ